MYKILIILTISFFAGCDLDDNLKVDNKKVFQLKHPPNYSGKLEVIIIDDCQYLYGYAGGNGGYVLCHKGNCNNPAHIQGQ